MFYPPLHKDENTFRDKSGNVGLECELPLGEHENLWVAGAVFDVDEFVPDDFEEDIEVLKPETSWKIMDNKLRFELGSTQAEAVRLQIYKKFKFS